LFHADWRIDGQTDRRRDGQRDKTKLIVAFRNFANALKNQLMLCGEIIGFYCEPNETRNTGLLVGKLQKSLKQVIHLVTTACSKAAYCHSDATAS
jgi:hypothetical protein